jgi:hypothetical protein
MSAAEEDDLDALLQQARFLEHGGQRRTRPGGVADARVEKWQAVVTRALHGEGDLLARTGFEIVARQGQRLLHQPADLEPPGLWVEDGFVIVRDREQLIVGSEPTVQFFPWHLLTDHIGYQSSREQR